MKRKVVLVSSLCLLAFSALASDKGKLACDADVQSELCQLYVAELVKNYVDDHKAYLGEKPSFYSKYANRAYNNRVGYSPQGSSQYRDGLHQRAANYQKYAKDPHANRAYLSRVGYDRINVAKASSVCLPEEINTTEAVNSIAPAGADDTLKNAIANHLQANYACK